MQSTQLLKLVALSSACQSSNFFVSDYCFDVEVTRITAHEKAGDVQVIPVFLRALDWVSWPLRALRRFHPIWSR